MVPATSVTAFAEGGTVMDRASMSAVIHEGEPYGYADVTPDDDYYTVELNDWQAGSDVYNPNSTYNVWIYLVAKEGYAFDANSFTLTVNGLVSNPTMTITGPDGTVTTITFPVSLAVSDTLLYSSVDGDLYCIKDSSGVETNIVPLFAVNATIFAKVPAGLSTITIPGSNVQIQFRKEYMAV